MDYIESLAKQASQITMYDVKSYYEQAKNMVLNLSEMEAKVAEATNNDPWGASSTLMQEIADGTHNFAQFNEIMPTIYSRFMEKEAREWRQIYKALTLLEFLVKNGSERVVDDARAHVSTIKMLRSFHYIDEKGKDQGINVRNRSSEIALLLGDVEKIRTERRKAKANKTKYSGQGNDGGMSFVTAGGSRYGGFGSESVMSGGGGGGGGGGSRYGGNSGYDNDDYRPSRSSAAERRADPEYDEYEGADDFEDAAQPPRRTGSAATSNSSRRPNPPPKNEPKAAKPVEKPKEVNLFDFDDGEPVFTSAPAAAAAPANVMADDDFDDFQSGPSTSAPPPVPAQSKPSSAANANFFDFLDATPSTQPKAAPSLSFVQPSQPAPSMPAMTARPSYSSYTSPPPVASSTTSALSPKPTGGSSTFDDLFTTSLTSMGGSTSKAKGAGVKSMGDMEKEKAMNKLWGPTSGAGGQQGSSGAQQKPANGGFDDLLF